MVAIPLACAVSLAVPYLLLLDYSAPRFLLPGYALLALPLATLAVRAPLRLAAAVLGPLLALQLFSQYLVLRDEAAAAQDVNTRYRAAAAELHRLGVRPPCLVTGPRALPVGYAAGCASTQVAGNNRDTTVPALLRRARKVPTAVLVPEDRRAPRFARDWSRHPLPGTDWAARLAP
ncbi:hypothetical protein G5C65_32655 [Streptomyces sp. SB3404]|uniref:Integral membrane protein n=1 Tax=Streptomyces boncukensis TaxID=2711219 RepID=A0A6G4X832_9ACTN|nr:hypothetical protein [Streptomyces boncukensis]